MLRIKTLGALTVTREGRSVTGAASQPRRLAMLALLARAGEQSVGRDRLIAVLWPDIEEERARRNLTHALYALRRDLGDEDTIQGAKDLRLDPERIGVDVREFTEALAQGRLAHAVSLYGGPFLDGFHLAGVPEFERWAEDERQALQQRFSETLETLARRAGDAAEATGWWRRLAGVDPLNARYALGLMEALAATGDVAGALRHARVHETLLAEQLELPPDRDVVALAERLRDQRAAPAASAGAAQVLSHMETAMAQRIAEPPTEPPAVPAPATTTPITIAAAPAPPSPRAPVDTPAGEISRSWPRSRPAVLAGAVLILAAAAIVRFASSPSAAERGATQHPVLAVGRIADRRGSPAEDLAGSLADMLATNLARAPGTRVVSTARMYELARQNGGSDTSAVVLLEAARRAGATELVDGALFALADGTLRLDVRRVDIHGGELRAVFSVHGGDPFALADSGTARLLASLGASAQPGSIAAVTTPSLAAYRLYEQGLRAWSRNNRPEAAELFAAALAEDSTFALAAYYYALSADASWSDGARALDRAVRLSARASERERLTIRAGWARSMTDPSLAAIADTLVRLYPDEVDGYLWTGQSLLVAGRAADAVAPLERVVSMDSLQPSSGAGPRCAACDALFNLIGAHLANDSLEDAERTARRWTRLQPQASQPWYLLAEMLAIAGRTDEALDANSRGARLERAPGIAAMHRARVLIYASQYASAAQLAREQLPSASGSPRRDLLWLLAIAERENGRLDTALAAARAHRRETVERPAPGSAGRGAVTPSALLEGAILMDRGEARAAAALFDSISRWVPEASSPSANARAKSWALTHAAAALAQAGDTVRLTRLIDTVRVYGAQSGFGRDRVLHHYVRGLLLGARGEWRAAEAEHRQALVPPIGGYARVNLELARALERQGRRDEAREVLRDALRGPFDGSGLYVSRTELRRRLAELETR
ncbi:MAG: transcriptional activator protein [Geminicoccaceae bacterium]|nr:transcriptional activator protein [Geminicoccaceae bacterium]